MNGLEDKGATIPWRFLTLVSLSSFGLNWIWEMVQMPAFVEMAGRGWRETALRCTLATIGDVMMTLAIYGLGSLAAKDIRWGMAGGWNVIITTALLGGLAAASFEWFSLVTGRWSYNENMPVVPILGVGLWPLLQLAVLVPLSFWLASRLIRAMSPRIGATGSGPRVAK